MADTATATPETTADTTGDGATDTAEYTVVTEPETTTDTASDKPKANRSRPRAMPLLIHGGNATGIAAGVAYGLAGVPGLIAAGAAGAAVGAAALAGRKKRSKVSAARTNAASNRSGGGTHRSGGGAGKGGLLGRGGGRGRGGGGAAGGGGRGPGRGGKGGGWLNGSGSGGGGTGTKNRPGGGKHGAGGGGRGPGGTGGGKHGRGGGLGGLLGGGRNRRGPGGPNSPGANTPKGTGNGKNNGGGKNGPGGKAGAHQQSRTGKAWQTLKGWGNKMRRNNGGTSSSGGSGSSGSGGGSSSGTSGSGTKTITPAKTRLGRALQKMRGLASKLRRSKKKSGSTSSGGSGPTSGRFHRMRRLAARKLGHWLRCAGAGLLAGLGGLATLPLGLLWGLALLPFKRRDPLHGFALPVRVAGRIWRFFFRRSKARHDKSAKADTLNLKVNNPRKDTDPVTGPSLAAGTTVLDGNSSKFAMAMRAAHASYTGYSPRSMMEVAAEYAGLPNGIRAAALAVQQMAVNADQKYPCSKKALAKLSEACAKLVAAAARADGMVAFFRMVHAFDIERIVAPRTNEWMWNVTPTGSDAAEGAMFMPGRIESGCVLMAVLYRTFEPVHMMQVGSEFQGIAYGLTALADCVQALYERTIALYPVDDRVTDEIGKLVSMIRAASDDADMAAKLFVEDHSREISHNTSPRKGPAAESMWNTPR
ncbi:hypothetical protein STTU_p0126 (plasmid) [Streptomyces sp. Tu6071]|uniref:hypothetical protein n=1 Tax=Streptomyces sp. Tu6071 TaxID=355249 RepID=UPI00020E6B50|nr:hypothetical protein [Streptomyces sp. Tu6071]EGJ72739.1 hypothetical protein STTU_p0126 [Streptomyces sp. Tu6071]